MPTSIFILDQFSKELKRLARKYPKVLGTVDVLIHNLKNGERPGDQIPNVGYEVYKVRMENLSANRDKSGGFRVIYYVQLASSIYLLNIYSKTEQSDINLERIQQAIKQADLGTDN